MRTFRAKSKEKLQYPVEEAYKTLRTNIRFFSIENRIQTIVVTSSVPGEGKTTTAINLALAMAQGGHRTILVDCDLRKPRIHKAFGISNSKGLSNVLISEDTFDSALYEVAINEKKVENLFVLPAGMNAPNPSELLGSYIMKRLIHAIKMDFEYIILDTPPVLLVTDAQILSQYADGCLLVVASGKVHMEDAMKAKSLLMNVNAKILGVVLNKVKLRKKRRYYDYYYGDNEKHKRN